MRRAIGLLLLLLACSAPFRPAYEGEPQCGAPETIHAIRDTACTGEVQVACDCAERFTLACVDGGWSAYRLVCSGALGVLAPRDGGP